jgi:predicted transcriptional regulator
MCLLNDYILKSPSNIMQVLNQLKIEEPERKEFFLEILSDKYCRLILEAIMDTPKSVIEISGEKTIPLSTVYRRIQLLHDSKMIRTSGVITDEGKRLFLYKSKIKEVNTSFHDGKIDVDVVFNKN